MISVTDLLCKSLYDGIVKIVSCLVQKYWRALFLFIYNKKSYSDEDIDAIYNEDTWGKVQVYSLSLIFTKLWSAKHYRSPSFQQDMIDNLRNVAVPGTGLPLSVFCYSYYVCLLFILFLNPLICLFGAINKARKSKPSVTQLLESKESYETFLKDVADHFVTHLIHPDDWFSFWRLNCRLVSLHSQLTESPDYLMEDKWHFLTKGKELGVPVSPYIDDIGSIVCKNKNIEGGMGIFFYKNAANGGDWIIQEKLDNCDWLNKLLPHSAPLSTMRVITSSSYTLRDTSGTLPIRSAHSQALKQTREFAGHGGDAVSAEAVKYIRAESAVLRLGREGASTDHSSVLFDVDVSTGTIKEGVTNAHWYQLGLLQALKCPWLPPQEVVTIHPDEPKPVVTGNSVRDMQQALAIVTNSHYSMMKDVPLVGWDVTFTPKGIFLLEVNLSCNFFKGTFYKPIYIEMVDAYWKSLERLERERGGGAGGGGGGGVEGTGEAKEIKKEQ